MSITPSSVDSIQKRKNPHRSPWWRSKSSIRVGEVAVILVLLAIPIWWFHFHPYVSTDDARVAATLVRVAPQGVSGRIVKINVTEGSKVSAGDVLLELDHRTAEAELARARAKFDLAAHDLRRAEQLSSQRGLSARDLDKTRAEAVVAESEVNLAKVVLDNTFLRTPIDGVIVQKTIEAGDILEPGQTALSVADIDQAWISANIEETSVGMVKAGQAVSISVDEGGDLSGTVLEVRAASASQFALIPSDNAAGNFTKLVQRIPIKVKLDPHPDLSLRVGQSVEIRVRVR